ncbi:MAG: hypothetical protein D6720_00240 [Gammaproteobacteria bacterium]|nr:MAG: hypothetical protein D6720_00240 [Gammaproteobacteria bacterium]
MTETEQSWLTPVTEALQTLPESRCLVVDIPVYRPDLARQLAAEAGLVFRDFRAEYLKLVGSAAEHVSIEAMDAWLVDCVAEAPTLFHNAEALLACHPPERRAEWFGSLGERTWPNRLVVPLYLFGSEIDGGQIASVALDYQALPEQGLVSRLLHS